MKQHSCSCKSSFPNNCNTFAYISRSFRELGCSGPQNSWQVHREQGPTSSGTQMASCIHSPAFFPREFLPLFFKFHVHSYASESKKRKTPKPYRVKSHNFATKNFHHMNWNITFQVIFIAKLQSLRDLVRKKSYRK
jgi:hypothetical protein